MVFPHEYIALLLSEVVFPHGFIAFSLLIFSRLPLGRFGSVLGCVLDVSGVHWAAFGPPWMSLGALGGTLGSLWRSLGPLGTILEDFSIIWGPADCIKGPEGDEERF